MTRELGFLFIDICEKGISDDELMTLKACACMCETLYVGIFSDSFWEKMNMTTSKVPFQMKRNMVEQVLDNVRIVELDENNSSIQKIWEEVHFEVYFSGSMYGRNYVRDMDYLKEHNVRIICLWEKALPKYTSLGMYLCQSIVRKNIVVFGTGNYCDRYMADLGHKYVPKYFVNNNSSEWEKLKDDLLIKSPQHMFENESMEDTLILICIKDYYEVEKQIRAAWPGADYRILNSIDCVGRAEELINILGDEKKYLDAIQNDMIKVLKEFDRVCNENGLNYYLRGGTLLGAVRHHGFVPWDDDIDVTMPYVDYEKLRDIALKEFDGENFLFVAYDDIEEGKFHDFVSRILYMKKEYPIGTYSEMELKDNKRIKNKTGLDIFVLKKASNSKIKQFLMESGLRLVYSLCMGHREKVRYEDYYENWSMPKILLLKVLNSIGRIIPFKVLCRLYERIGNMANNENARFLFESNLNILYISTKVRTEVYGKGQRVQFDDIMVNVSDYPNDQLTESGYSGYQNLPPASSRRPSHVSVFKAIGW